MTELIRQSEQDGVVLLEIDNPPVNAVATPHIEALCDVARALDPDRPVVLTGRGKAFSAGVDTTAFGAYSGDERATMILAITQMVAALLARSAPLVAAVNGHAIGGGMVLMLCADYRMAADGPLKIGLAEAQAGVPFPAGPLEIIRSEIEPGILRRLTLSSQLIDAQTAHAAGLVDELCSGEKLIGTAVERAAKLASQPAFSVVKQQVRGPLAARVQAIAQAGIDPLADVMRKG